MLKKKLKSNKIILKYITVIFLNVLQCVEYIFFREVLCFISDII